MALPYEVPQGLVLGAYSLKLLYAALGSNSAENG